VVGAYQANVGLMYMFLEQVGVLYGWGEGTFGSTSALSETNQLRIWTHDNFGEDLIINQRNSGIYKWTENNGVGTRAVELSGISGANLSSYKSITSYNI
jgi:hypothetical protein